MVNDLIQSSSLEKKQKDLIETLHASTNNLAAAINRIADVSQPDLMLKESRISFELTTALQNIIQLFNKYENLKIDLNVSDHIENFLIGDTIKLRQIFLNLLQSILIYYEKDIQQKRTPRRC